MIPLETWLAFVVKGSVVLAAAGGAAFTLRRSSAAVRHTVWAAALVSLAILPLASAIVPRVAVRLPVWDAASPEPATRMTHAPVRAAVRVAAGAVAAPHVAEPATAAMAIAGSTQPAASPRVRLSNVIVSAWLVGTLAVLVRMLGGLAVLRRLRASARPIDGIAWHERASRAAAELGMSAVSIRKSDRIAVPVTFGVVRPLIVLPDDAGTWDGERARVVLLHELAHVRRRDCLVHLVAQCALALHWMNPLAWLAVARLRVERERACDDLVLACGTSGPRYAEHLLDIARTASRRPVTAAALAMARPSELEGRLLAVLDRTVRRSTSGTRAALAAMIVAGTAVSLVAAVTVEQSQSAPAVPQPALGPTPAPTPAPAPAPTPKPHPAPTAGVTGGVRGGVAGGKVAPAAGQGHQGKPVIADGNDDENARPVRQDVVEALVGALKDESPEVRQQAMHALTQVRSPAIVEPMIAALSDSNAEVRQSAAAALGQVGDPRAAPALSRLLSDADADVRQQAVFALGQLGAKESGPALIKALGDSDAEVRQRAAFALGQLGDRSAVPGLVSALGDKVPDVRQQAAFALGQIGDEAAVDVLTKALKDPNAEVRQQAAFALGQVIGHDRDHDEKDPNDEKPHQ
jgi:HEAT repeat protein/beta-lactamase regulating signal transducer with metallopeptidase domain